MATRRTELRFTNYKDIIQDIQRLQKSGYEMTGKWNLGQICRHLSFYWKGSLDGFTVQLPWIIRATLGRMILKSSLRKPFASQEDKPRLNLYSPQSRMTEKR